jgi:hydroxyacylglutathione hydrolase
MLQIIPLPAFRDNYIWLLRRGSAAAAVDPGDAGPVFNYLDLHGLSLVAVLNTHHHGDHVGGNRELLERYDVPIYGPRHEPIPGLTHPVDGASFVKLPELDLEFQVLDVPGHTRAHVAYYGANSLFCGDTLFACGCGRLFEGTAAQMHHSLQTLAALPPETHVYCAHEYTLSNIRFAKAVEPDNAALLARERAAIALRAQEAPTLPSTLELERQTNPFLRCAEAPVRAAAERHAARPLATPLAVFAALRAWKDDF